MQGLLRRHELRGTVRAITLLAALAALLLTMVTPLTTPAADAALGTSSNLDQWANGEPGTDPSVAGFWHNGNLNPNNSQYAEGESIAFRRIMSGFTPGETYRVTINYDMVNNGLVAYDYLTSWNRTEVEADPTAGVAAHSGAPDDLQPITTDPRLAATPGFLSTPSGPADMAAWGADVLYVGNYRYSSGNAGTPYSSGGTTTTTVDIVFDATASDVLLAWGGHIAVQAHWDEGAGYLTAPRNTNGSPYHMRNSENTARLQQAGLDPSDPSTWVVEDSDNVGNQDRSIKAGAILLPGLNLQKTTLGDVTTVAPGDSFTYRLTVANSGEAGSALTNVHVSDPVPSIFDVTNVTSSSPTCGFVDQLVECDFASIAAGDAVTIDITVDVVVDPTVDGQECGTYPNTANATADDDLAAEATFDVTVEGCAPDIAITKSTDPAVTTVGFGDTFDYVLTVTNAADATDIATNVVVTDSVPGAFSITATPTASQGSCLVAGQDVTCTLGDIDPGGSVTITIPVEVDVVVNGCDTFPNSATAGADNHAPVDSNTVDVEVEGCAPDVTLDKSASPTSVDVDGGTTTYTLVATNAADATATASNVTVTDSVPAIFDITSATWTGPNASGDCTIVGNDVTCGPDDLDPGESLTVTIAVTVDVTNVDIGTDGDYCGTVTNDGAVTLTNGPGDTDTADVAITGCAADVTLGKTADPTSVDVDGDTTTYTIVATNDADATATAFDVEITDSVPAIFDITSATWTGPNASGDCTIVGQDVTCGPDDLDPGETLTATITVTADVTNDGVSLDQDGDHCNTVTNDGEVEVGGQVVDNDTADVDVTGCETDLDIVKSTDLADPPAGNPVVGLGDSFDYLLTVTVPDNVTASALDVVVTDEIPGSFTIDTASFAGDATGDCDVTGQVVTCELGDLAPGAEVLITIEVTVPVVADTCDTYPNDAEADASNIDGNPDATSNLVNVDVEGCVAALDLVKDASADTVDVDGGSLVYTLTATNAADATATAHGVTITDTVPAILDVVSATYAVDGGTDVACDVVGNDVSCGPESLGPGSSMVATIDTVIDLTNVDYSGASFCGPITNQGVLSALVDDVDTAIDEDSATVEVDGCDPDVSINKSVADDQADVTFDGDDTATFVLEVANAETATATALGVTITDVVDSAFEIVSVTPEADCTVDGQTVTCGPVDLAPGDAWTVTVEVTAVGGPDSCGTFPNSFDVAWVDGYDEDAHEETSNDVTLDVVGCEPAIDLVKEVDVTEAEIGDVVTYTYTITNTGDLTLHNVQLIDEVEISGDLAALLELLGFDVSITLAPGESITITSTHVVTEDDLPGPIDNVAIVTGQTEDGQEVSDESDQTVIPFGAPSVDLDKVAVVDGADGSGLPSVGVDPDDPGATLIPYEFTVTNTGNVTLADLTLTDLVLIEIPEGPAPSFAVAETLAATVVEVTLDATTLAPGASTTGTITYSVTGTDVDNALVVNVAEVTGVSPDGVLVSAEDPEAVGLVLPDVAPPPPPAPPPAEVEALPVTGVDADILALWALLVAGLGVMLLLMDGPAPARTSRRRQV